MSKPWDHLRKPVQTPIGEGKWKIDGTPEIEISNFVTNIKFNYCREAVKIRFGHENNSTVEFNPNGLRMLAEFCTELADQMDKKSIP